MEAKPTPKEIAEFSDFLAEQLQAKGKKDVTSQDIKAILDPALGKAALGCDQCANGWRW